MSPNPPSLSLYLKGNAWKEFVPRSNSPWIRHAWLSPRASCRRSAEKEGEKGNYLLHGIAPLSCGTVSLSCNHGGVHLNWIGDPSAGHARLFYTRGRNVNSMSTMPKGLYGTLKTKLSTICGGASGAVFVDNLWQLLLRLIRDNEQDGRRSVGGDLSLDFVPFYG